MHVNRCAFALDLVRLTADDHRENVAARQHGIDFNCSTIQMAFPTLIQAIQFEPVVLAVNVDLVSHVEQLSAFSNQPTPRARSPIISHRLSATNS
jgi:hypothetical protein